MEEKYFIVQDGGYDGWSFIKCETYEEAKEQYDYNVKTEKEHFTDLPDISYSDLPIYLIKGTIIESFDNNNLKNKL